MSNVHACSFASENFQSKQSMQVNDWINVGIDKKNIHLGNESNLLQEFYEDIPFASKNNYFGYYSFKPYFLSHLLSRIPESDFLIYLDVNDRPLMGIKEYVQETLINNQTINILAAATNYPNAKHMSWFHSKRSTFFMKFISTFFCQPEAGLLVVRNCFESRALIKAWYEITRINANAINLKNDNCGRHDQEALFIISQFNNTIKFQSWILFKLKKLGLRNFVDWEYYREKKY